MEYSFYWDDRLRLLLIYQRASIGPKVLRISAIMPEGDARVLAITPVCLLQNEVLCPTAAVHIPEDVQRLVIEPVLAAGGAPGADLGRFFAEIELHGQSYDAAAPQSSYWVVKRTDSVEMLGVRSKPDVKDGELLYDSVISGNSILPAREWGAETDRPRIMVKLTPLRIESDIHASERGRHFNLTVAMAPESPAPTEDIRIVCSHATASGAVLKALAEQKLTREIPTTELWLNAKHTYDQTTVPFPDDPDAPEDSPLGFLDRLIFEVDQNCDLIYDDGSDDPPLIEGGVMVLAFYEESTFVVDKYGMLDLFRKDPSTQPELSRRDQWQPHQGVSDTMARAMDRYPGVRVPSAAAFSIAYLVLRGNEQDTGRGWTLATRDFDEYLAAPQLYHLLFDPDFFRAAIDKPSYSSPRMEWLLQVCSRRAETVLRDSGADVDLDTLDAWVDSFRDDPWKLCELLMLPIAEEVVRNWIDIGAEPLETFVNRYDARKQVVEEILATERHLKEWGIISGDVRGPQTLRDILNRERKLKEKRDQLFKAFGRAQQTARFHQNPHFIRGLAPQDDVYLCDLAHAAFEQMKGDLSALDDLPEDFRSNLAQSVAAAMNEDCAEVESIGRALNWEPASPGGETLFQSAGGATGLNEATGRFAHELADASTARMLDEAKDALLDLPHSGFTFVNRAIAELRRNTNLN